MPTIETQGGGGGESQAIDSAECYSAHPLNSRSPRTLFQLAVPAKASGEFSRLETMNRE